MNKRFKLQALMGLAFVFGLASDLAHAEIPLTDSRSGVTCHFYASIGRLEWRQPGGDWTDAAGKPYGQRAFALAQVSQAAGSQKIRFDVTPLAREWNREMPPLGAMMIRAMQSRRGGIVNFSTRENEDPGSHPVLHVEWDDGRQVSLEAEADTYQSCPTHRSLGDRKFIQVGDGNLALFVFPFEARAGREVAKATLELTSAKQYGGGAQLGVFRPYPPNLEPQPLRSGIASRYPRDAAIETDPDVIFAESFERSDWTGNWSDFDPAAVPDTVTEDSRERFEALDRKALKVTVARGERQGLNMHLRMDKHAGREPEEVYFRYYLRLGESWNPNITGGKLPGIAGTYNRGGWGGRTADGTNGWSARGQFFQTLASEPDFKDFRPIGSYLYHADGKTKYGDPLGWNLGPTGMLEKNRWYSIEQYVKLNSLDKADGILRAWVDGRLVFEKTDVRYRSVPELKIESVWMNVYHGGTARAKSDLSLFIDNVVVARKYIGPLQSADSMAAGAKESPR